MLAFKLGFGVQEREMACKNSKLDKSVWWLQEIKLERHMGRFQGLVEVLSGQRQPSILGRLAPPGDRETIIAFKPLDRPRQNLQAQA